MRRTFWFGLGVAAGVSLTRRVGSAARKVAPSGAAEQLGSAVRELAVAVGSFGADVRAGMAEREDELRGAVAERTGLDPAPRHLAAGAGAAGPGPRWTPSAREGARARRAGGAPARP